MLRKDHDRRPSALDILRMPQLRQQANQALLIAAKSQPTCQLPQLVVPHPLGAAPQPQQPHSYRDLEKFKSGGSKVLDHKAARRAAGGAGPVNSHMSA